MMYFFPTPPTAIVSVSGGHRGKNKATPLPRELHCVAVSSKVRERRPAGRPTPAASAPWRGGVPETPVSTLTFPNRHRARIACMPICLIGTSVPSEYLTHGSAFPRSVRLAPYYGWPPPARCFLPHPVHSCRLLHHNSAANAGGSCPVLHGLHLPPYKRDRVRTRLLPFSSLVTDRRTVPRSTTLGLRLIVRLPAGLHEA
jgi:hypothetical protein